MDDIIKTRFCFIHVRAVQGHVSSRAKDVRERLRKDLAPCRLQASPQVQTLAVLYFKKSLGLEKKTFFPLESELEQQ